MYPIRIIPTFEKAIDHIIASRTVLIGMKFEHR